jgi:sulfatase modifying factor 1
MKIRSLLTLAATAALITSAAASVTIHYVSVGHAGNAADPTTGFGAVAYDYQIGKYEVTNAQYTEFLNAVQPYGTGGGGIGFNGVYNANMGSHVRGGINYTDDAADGAKYTIRSYMGDKPVNFVSWYDAARFTNWLHNGQGSGSTEKGAYTLSGNTGIVTKNVGATVYLPSEDEWYKAAYYDPTTGAGGGDNYWAHATRSDTAPTEASANSTGGISNPSANVANYNFGANWNGQVGNVTTVGSAGAAANSYFGTADQAGNVWEWNDAVIFSTSRGLRGGSWYTDSGLLAASYRNIVPPASESSDMGFRVASVPVPEPSAFLVSMLLVSAVLIRRHRSPR